jgi:flagellar basal body rod protein FlgG
VTEEITYTRDGTFRLSLQSDGRFFLTSQDGKAVMSTDNEPIVVTEENKDEMLPIAVFCFRNQNGMLHAGGNEYRPVGKNNEAVLMEGSSGMLRQYCTENSNVDIADEFVKMIESQRAYQYALKMVQTTDEIESTINGLRQ